MIDFNKNYLALITAVVSIIFGVVLVNNLMIDKITNKVIDQLKREYTPGPYDPGFDPGKVPNNIR
jgi:hypothetical protein